jgi:hypothetical protein
MNTETTTAAKSAAIVTTENLILVGPGYSLEIPESADKRKLALILAAQQITEVSTTEQAEDASGEIKALAKIRNEIERGRTAVKAPVIALGKRIDEKAKEFGDALQIEETRLTGLVSDHAYKIEVARRQAEAEARRITQEREAAARRAEAARIAEVARIAEEARQAEVAAAAAIKAAEDAAAKQVADDAEEDIEAEMARAAAIDAKNAADKAAIVAAEIARIAEEERQAESARLAEEQRQASVAATQQVKGVSFPIAFEVEDIAELYKAYPALVDLTIRTRDTKDFLKAKSAELDDQIPTIPGLRVFREAKVGTR